MSASSRYRPYDTVWNVYRKRQNRVGGRFWRNPYGSFGVFSVIDEALSFWNNLYEKCRNVLELIKYFLLFSLFIDQIMYILTTFTCTIVERADSTRSPVKRMGWATVEREEGRVIGARRERIEAACSSPQTSCCCSASSSSSCRAPLLSF